MEMTLEEILAQFKDEPEWTRHKVNDLTRYDGYAGACNAHNATVRRNRALVEALECALNEIDASPHAFLKIEGIAAELEKAL